ncbi:MAG TPA: hypothetical protein VIH27_02265 [Nitrososphaerales archaeon]
MDNTITETKIVETEKGYRIEEGEGGAKVLESKMVAPVANKTSVPFF